MSGAPALEGQVRAWLRPQILDAEESRRRWRLLCIQADAELRNLKSQTHRTSSNDGCDSPVQHKESSESVAIPCLGGLPAIEEASSKSSSPIVGRSFCIDSSDAPESEKALGNVLALERQVEELYSVIANTERELLQVLDCSKVLEERLSNQSACAQRAAANADTVRSEVKDLASSHSRAREEHKKRCESLVQETESLKLIIRPREVVEADFHSAQVDKAQLHEDVTKIAVDIEEVLRHRELLWMHREELRTIRENAIDSRNQSAREVSTARNVAKAHNLALNRLQGEVLRIRSRSERKRRVLESQLIQCRSELEDAKGRDNTSAEQLRKMKYQQGKQLRSFREEIDGLQSEVDEHLLAIRTSESDLEGLHHEEAAIETDRHRHIAEESALAERAVDFGNLVMQLESEVFSREFADRNGRARLAAANEELSEDERLREAMWTEVQALRAAAREAEANSDRVKKELEEERQLYSSGSEEFAHLHALQQKVEDLKARSKEESTELSQMQESANQMQKRFNKHLEEMSEALRRVSRVKTQHGELVEGLPSTSARGREVLISSMDQTLGKVSRKVDAVISCLDVSAPTPRTSMRSTPRGSDAHMTSPAPSSQAALQKRLQNQHEQWMEALCAEERKKVLMEQRRSLDEAERRTMELRRVRQERRQQEEELIRSQQARDWARRSCESEIQGLEAQAKLVDREATEGAKAVTAEFSDVVQKQELERNQLQAQVDQLRMQVEGAVTPPQKQNIIDSHEDDAHEKAQIMVSGALSQRLAAAEAEADSLRGEEEELQQAYIKLKAAMVASNQRNQDSCN